MSPPDDRPDFEPADEVVPDDWFDRLSPDEQAEHLAAVDRGIAQADAGQLIPIEDVMTWVRSWGTENELPRPQCK